jgi:type I restriction enzyme, S subunit
MSDLYDLPNGWEWETLDNSTEKIIDGNYGESYPTKDEFLEDGIPFLTAAAIGVNGIIEYDKIKYISEEKQSILTKAQTTVGDVILVNRGVKNDFSNISSIIEDDYFTISNISPQLTKLKTNDRLNSKLLYYYFYSEPFLNQFKELTMGSALRFISLTKTKKIKIPLPPLSEQQRIVSKLDNLFEKIDKGVALHQKNMDEADVFMGSVLNDVFGELEEKYEKKQLGDITNVIGGGTPKRNINEYWDNGDIVWLSPTDLGLIGEIGEVSDSKDKITQLGLDKSSAKLLPIGTVLYSSRATIGKISINTVEVSTNQGFSNFVCKDDLYNRFLAYSLSKYTDDIVELSNSTTFKEVSKTNLKAFSIPKPPLNIQQKVVNYLDDVSEKIEKVKSIQKDKMDGLKALKASILDKAFRGKI